MTIAQYTTSDLKAEAARRSFPEYCEYVHGRPLYPHQLAWLGELERSSRSLIIAPPETLKSSTVRMLLEWEIGRRPDIATLLVMNTASQAQKQVMSIAETLEHNLRYREVFPSIEPHKARGWSHEVLFVKRDNEAKPDPTIYGTGIDGPYQGLHVDRLVIDDPTDQQDVRSKAVMDAQRDRLDGVLIDRLENAGGKCFAILTRWGEADLVGQFRKMGFSVLEQPIEGRYPWGRLLAPELFGDDRILAIRSTKGGALYQMTYMCDPSAAEGSLIKREWWRMYGEAPKLSRPIHSWDLSTGTSDLGDYTSFGSWGVGEDGFYLTDAGRWKLDMDGVIKKMQLLYTQQKPTRILVEEAGNSIPIIQYLKKHTHLPIFGVKPGTRDKVSRLRAVVHLIEAGRVWVPGAAQWLQAFIDESAAFPGGEYDDQVDQMTQALAYLDKHRGSGDGGGEPLRMGRHW